MHEETMDEEAMVRSIVDTFADVDVLEADGDRYFYYQPRDASSPSAVEPDRRHPFATLVTGDRHDTVSQLERPGVFRLNIGVSPATYRARFGAQPTLNKDGSPVATGHDFAALDEIMPHPVYAAMSWVCVLNPSATTFQAVQPLLAEAHALAVRRFTTKGR